MPTTTMDGEVMTTGGLYTGNGGGTAMATGRG
jgi:hypothetical protein